MDKKKISLILGIVCVILTYSICIQLKTVSSTNTTIAQTLTENNLRDEVLKWKERYDNVQKGLEQSEKVLEEKRQLAASDDISLTAKEEEIKLGNMMLGLSEVKGKGVTVTLNDNHSVTLENIGALDSIDYYLVHDGDIRVIIEELKNAGAEAISVNDQRIVNLTAITCDGNVVKVNGEKVGAPYIIKAIGLPESLNSALIRPGGAVEAINSTGAIAEVKKSNSITILKYNGILSSKFMEDMGR